MDYTNLEEQTKHITLNLNKLNKNIFTIKNKVFTLTNINFKLEQNKMLKHESNNKLQFQTNILKNELCYYKNIYSIILEKYSKELYDLTEYILIILLSLNKLEIDNTNEKKSIYNKIIFTKKNKNPNSGTLKEIVNNIINNLKVIDDFIKLFDEYIKSLSVNNMNKNIHNTNFELNISYKKQSILLEYNKYCDKFIKTITYFKESSDSVIEQIESSKLLIYFLKLKANV